MELKNLSSEQCDFTRGKLGEKFVSTVLLDHGYAIEQRNFKSPYGEIDLIVSKNKKALLIEIKTRVHFNSQRFEPIGQKQKLRLKNAMTWYWVKNKSRFFKIDCQTAVVTHGGIIWRNLPLLYDTN